MPTDDNRLFSDAIAALLGVSDISNKGLSFDNFPGLLRSTSPSKWTKRYREEIVARGNRRIEGLDDRMNGITDGRVMPDRDDITIGSGKHFNLSVLFLDICNFSSRPNWTNEEQISVLRIMNVFMAEMLSIVKDFSGTFEKNTGDGLMAYFGEGGISTAERVKAAVEAATVMHFFNDQLCTPWLKKENVPPLHFRIGIDDGPVTIARVGIGGESSSRVAIGTPANIACKLMNLIPNGGVCIGDVVYQNLPNGWAGSCQSSARNSGFIYVKSQQPYLAWELNYRLTEPMV
jgi:adenylate cyclase